MIGNGRPKAVHADSSGSKGRGSTRRSQRSTRYQMLNPLHIIDDIHELTYRSEMIVALYHPVFDKRQASLCEQRAADRLVSRIRRVRFGHMCDVKAIEGISELHIDYGPEYRVYFVRMG